MSSTRGSGTGTQDVTAQLFGPGALRGVAGSAKTSRNGSPKEPKKLPLCVRLAAASLATWGGGEALDDLIPLLPGGGSRDSARAMLGDVISYSPAAAAALGGGAAISTLWWYRSKHRGAAGRELRRKNPTAADRAVSKTMKLPEGAAQAYPRWKFTPPWPRLNSVTVTYPPGVVQENPSRGVAKALAVVYGVELCPEDGSWKPHKGRFRLRPGALPPEPEPETTPPQAAALDPVERAKESLATILGKEGKGSTDRVVEAYDDGIAKIFVLQHHTTPKVASESNQLRLAELLSAMQPKARGGRGWEVIPRPDRNEIEFIDKKAMPSKVLRPLGDLREQFPERSMILPVGQDENEKPLGFDAGLSTDKPHGLIVGPTGTGKTSLIRSAIVAASHHKIEMWGADPKRIELLGFDDWPGFTRLAVGVTSMGALIRDAYDEMMNRYDLIHRRQAKRSELAPMLVILDEFLILRSMLIADWKAQENTKGLPPELAMVTDMLALARSARVHLLIGVQRPDAELFDKGARDNLRFRVTLGQLSAEGADMMWENRRIGTTPTGINGRGVATGLDGAPTEMQAWWTPSLSSHPIDRDDMTLEEQERVDALRPQPWTSGSWSTTASGLVVPESDSPDVRRNVPRGGAEEALADVIDVVRARMLEERMRIQIEDATDALEPATVEHVEWDGPGTPVLVDLQWANGDGEQRELDEGDEVQVLAHAPQLV